MDTLVQGEIDHPLMQMVRSHLLNDDRLDVRFLDQQLGPLTELFKRRFDNYLNEDRTNHAQARELALNDVRKKILKG